MEKSILAGRAPWLNFLNNHALVGLVVQQPTLREPYWSLPISNVLDSYNDP
jgi:hypothetical protein